MFRYLVLFATVLTCTAPVRSQPTSAWKLNRDTHFFLELKTDMRDTVRAAGEEHTQQQEMTGVFEVTFSKKKPPENYSLMLDVKVLSLKSRLGGKDEPLLEKLQGETFGVPLNNRMEVGKLEGLEAILRNKLNEGPRTPEGRVAHELLEGFFHFWMDETFVSVPAGVKSNDTWEQKTEQGFGPFGKMQLLKKFTTASETGAKDWQATVTAQFEFSGAEGQDAGLPFKIGSVKINKAEYKGKVQFDLDAGRLVQEDVSMNSDLSITVSRDDKNVTVPAQREQRLSIRLLKENPLK